MDFTPTAEQAAARDLAAQIFGDLSTPERLAASGTGTDAELWKALCAAGLPGAVEEIGLLGLVLLLEEQGRTTAQVPFAASCVYGLLAVARTARRSSGRGCCRPCGTVRRWRPARSRRGAASYGPTAPAGAGRLTGTSAWCPGCGTPPTYWCRTRRRGRCGCVRAEPTAVRRDPVRDHRPLVGGPARPGRHPGGASARRPGGRGGRLDGTPHRAARTRRRL